MTKEKDIEEAKALEEAKAKAAEEAAKAEKKAADKAKAKIKEEEKAKAKAEAKAEKEAAKCPYRGRKISYRKITKVDDTDVFGKPHKLIYLEDDSTLILTEEALKKQLS